MDMAHIMWKRMACRFKKQDNRVDISELITALVQHMTDFCQTISMSINSPLRFTPLSKSYWFFFTRHYGCSSRGSLCRICNVFARRVRIGGLLLLAKGNRGGALLRYRYRKGPLDLSFTPQYPQHRQQQTQCNQSL